MTQDLQTTNEDCAIAYKEWAGVCHALGTGRQTILLRKGGIREEDGIFRPASPRFWLYPTNVHEEQQGLREVGSLTSSRVEGTIAIEFLAEVESVQWLDRMEIALKLDDYHVWTAETIRKRFAYRTPGLWVLAVRVFRLPVPVLVPELPEYAGCKTWVSLDRPISQDGLIPVLSDREARDHRESLAKIFDHASEQE